jgi:ABC-type uncharacterized transport system involved in gliding motility auxiliary subunit
MISPALRHYALVILGTLGLLGVLGGLTASAYLHNLRVDLSPGDRFTLSDHALAVLRGLDEPIRLTGFIRTEDPRNPILKDLLWQAGKESSFITYTVIDVNRNPALAAEYGVDSYGSTVVESAERRTNFANPSETQLVSALLYVTQPPKKVYALGGHAECDLSSQDRHVGCSGLSSALQSQYFVIEDLSLLADKPIPDDAAIVLIAGARQDPVAGELRALDDYLEHGGKLLVLLEPFEAPRLAAWLKRYGIDAGENVIVDPDNRLAGGEPFSAAVPELNSRHLVPARIDGVPLFSGMRSVSARSDEDAGRDAVWLVRSGARSWASHDPAVLRGEPTRFVAGRDLNGPLGVGVEVILSNKASDESGDRGRILVYGDSDFVTNRFLDYLGNRDLILNTVNWLAREERLVAPHPKRKQAGKNVFFPNQADLEGIFWMAAVVQPGAFFAVGVVLLVWRRLRP